MEQKSSESRRKWSQEHDTGIDLKWEKHILGVYEAEFPESLPITGCWIFCIQEVLEDNKIWSWRRVDSTKGFIYQEIIWFITSLWETIFLQV